MSHLLSTRNIVLGSLIIPVIMPGVAAAAPCAKLPPLPTPTRFESPHDPAWKAAISAAGQWNQRGER